MKKLNLPYIPINKTIIVLIFVFIQFGILQAQWSNNPSSNLILCQQGSPMSARIAYSGEHYYITYFKRVNSNYCLHLQVLDFNGKPMFEGDGLVISNYRQKTTTLSELIVDLDGNVVVAFSDTRNEEYSDISLYKMDVAGNQLWGEDGINFFIPGTNDAGPKMAVSPDNSITVCFGSFNKINTGAQMQMYLYRISENGILLWNSEPRIIKDEAYSFTPEGMMSCIDGSILLAYYFAVDIGLGVHIMVKKIDCNGFDVWPKDLLISNRCLGGSTRTITYVGEDGIFYLAWHAHGCADQPSAPYIQGITPDGNILWPEPGVRISEDRTHDQYHPVIQGLNSAGDIFVLWYTVSRPSGFTNLFGQFISQDGELKWGNDGIEIKENFHPVFAYGSIVNDTAIVIYTDPVFNIDMFQAVKAIALDKDGSFCWPHEVVVNDLRTSKAVDGFTPIGNGQGVIVFREDDGILTAPRMVAQNIWTDGTIGLKTSATDPRELNPEIRVFFRPDEGIIIDGLTRQCDIMIFNTLGQYLHQVKGVEMGSQFVKIDTLHWNPGIYFVKILQKEGKVTCSKVLIN
ncbi:MAG: T9SS C-terminal target domain-containing protein [Porphyromonadaceae bacterium]|nr:MAG: T9SS C-terminal target domain-containing protein [Porphyromonadaceae bacterium]